MSDVFSMEKRSWIMSRISGGNTKPEIVVRKILHGMGYRFRLHVKNLPGKPDIVLPRLKKVIFVHGCFWHGHEGCKRSKRPTTNVEFWYEKIEGNIRRDAIKISQLQELGWNVLILWACEIIDPVKTRYLLHDFLEGTERETTEGE
jgi:DNA mismatch endonuclease (patch repair protein)